MFDIQEKSVFLKMAGEFRTIIVGFIFTKKYDTYVRLSTMEMTRNQMKKQFLPLVECGTLA